jgi:hypothetical protein
MEPRKKENITDGVLSMIKDVIWSLHRTSHISYVNMIDYYLN